MSCPVILVIPAYKPPESLWEMVFRLEQVFYKIIIVDDGSGEDYHGLFEKLTQSGKVELLKHRLNCGKGLALKTAFQYIIEHHDNCNVITADADGQHRVGDIIKIAELTAFRSDALIIGCRNFKTAPLRNRFGNLSARGILRLLTKRNISDTQTGLRGIPACFLPELIGCPEVGYDFEMRMLMSAIMQGYQIVETDIETIYPGDPVSHFSPLYDSMKIVTCAIRECFRNKFDR